MNTRYLCTHLVLIISMFSLTGCFYTANHIRQAKHHAYQSGVADGRASAVRQGYHARQNTTRTPSRVRPPDRAPVKKRYYEVPIPAHTAPDGVRIDAHRKTIEIIQP